MPKSKMTHEQVIEAVKLRLSGKDTKDIIEEMGLPMTISGLEQTFFRLRKMGADIPKKRDLRLKEIVALFPKK